jgi:hypothetical protein
MKKQLKNVFKNTYEKENTERTFVDVHASRIQENVSLESYKGFDILMGLKREVNKQNERW